MLGIHKGRFLLTAAGMISAVVLASIVVSVVSPALVQATTQDSGCNYGDANRSGTITTMDRGWLNQMILETRAFDSVADCNMDGRITTMDRGWLNQILLETRTVVSMMVAEYDFSAGAGTNRWAKSNSLSDLPPILSDTFDTDPVGWVEANSGQYINISEEHTDVWMIVAASNAALQCKFTIDEGPDAGDITSIRVYFNGSSESSGDVLEFWVWNFAGAAWMQIGSGVSLSTINESHNSGWAAWGKVYGQYIDSNNYMYILLVNAASANDLNVNYVELELATPTEFIAPTPTVSPMVSPTISPTVSPTVSPTISPTVSPTVSPTESPTLTASPTESPTPSATVTESPTPSATPTESPPLSATVTESPTPTVPPCNYTYNFTLGAGVDKWAYESGNSGGQPPLPPLLGTGPDIQNEVAFTSYSGVSAADDIRYTTTSNGNKFRSQRFTFTISEATANISSLYVEWEGYAEAADSVVYIWNYTSGGWEEVGRHSTTTADGVVSATYTSNISNYIDASGLLHVVATGPKSNGLALRTDYVKVLITAPCLLPTPSPTPTATIPLCAYNYNFSSGGGVDKWAYKSDSSGGQPPLPGTSPAIQNEVTFTSYTEVSAADDVRYITTSTGKKFRSQRFTFTINETVANISSLYVEWEGYAESADSIVYIWNYTSAGWEEVGRHSTTAADGVVSATYTSNISRYIDGSGLLHVVAAGPKSNQPLSAVHTDYVEVVVTAPCP